MKKYSSITRVSSRRTSPTKKRIGAFVIVGLIVLFLLWLTPKLFAGAAALIMTPIEATKTWLFQSSGNLPQYFRDRTVLIAENEKLVEQIALLEGGTKQTLELFRRENKELRALLGDEGEERVLAAVIGRPGALPYDVLVIDRGILSGVSENAPVFIGENRVIGYVRKVFADSAVVELVTTPGFTSSVFIIGPNIYTNAVGVGGGQLRVGVPQGIELSQGDSVILPAVSSGIFGTINHIESSPSQPEQYGFVATDVPLQSLRYVAVGRAPIAAVTFEEAQEVVQQAMDALFAVPVPEGVLVVVSGTTTPTTTVENIATSTATTSNEEPAE